MGSGFVAKEDMISQEEYMDMYIAVGIAIEVYNILGRAMEREKPLHLTYKDVILAQTFTPDFYYRGLIMEFKSVDEVMPVHRAQLLNYLRFAKQRRGILFNFGETNLHTERYLYLTSEDRFVMLNKDNIHLYVSR